MYVFPTVNSVHSWTQPVATDGVASCVGRSVTAVRSAKTAEPIEMQFEMLSRVGPGSHDGSVDVPTGSGTFGVSLAD